MKWSLQELNKKESVTFDTTFELSSDLQKRDPEILGISPIVVKGRVDASNGIYSLTYAADYCLTMPSSRSLAPVDVPMTLNVAELFTTQVYFETHQADLDADVLFILDKDLIDLTESVADNILLEIPLQVLTQEEKQTDVLPSGTAWQVLSEETYKQMQAEEEQVDKPTAFSQLDGLFD